MSPKVSIIMPVYNNESYLKEAIQSMLKQSFEDFELIIIDDGSTDRSFEIIKSFKDERIILLKNKSNMGVTKSLNSGIQKASGDYIARMDGDDISNTERLQKQNDFLDAHTDIVLCGTGGILIDERGQEIEQIPIGNTYEAILGNMIFYNQFIHPSLMFRKEIIEKIGMYNEDYPKAQDYELLLRLIQHDYRLENIEDTLINYREHSNSVSTKSQNSQEDYASVTIKNFLENKLNISVRISSIKIYRNLLLKSERANIFEFSKCLKDLKKIKRVFLSKYSNAKIKETFEDTIERIINLQTKSKVLRRIYRNYLK